MENLITTIITFTSGGAIWEGFKFFYPDPKRPIEARLAAKKTFYKNLDPILKSSSELYGKLLSLANEDFSSFINPCNSNATDPEHNQKYVYYLFAQFWAHLEYLRLESQYIDLAKIKKGKNLLRFIKTFEARKYRILDRSVQRIIGECLITNENQKFRILTLKEFLDELNNPESGVSRWTSKLETKLLSVSDKNVRQQILRFGIIIAVMIDYFDPKHETVRREKLYLIKLTKKSLNIIRNPLLNRYLPFTNDKSRYYKK